LPHRVGEHGHSPLPRAPAATCRARCFAALLPCRVGCVCSLRHSVGTDAPQGLERYVRRST
jgi:hypothetical protein